MSGYETEDRLALLERDFQTDPEDIMPPDVAWLLSEVRRYRDEENPNQAAIYWRTIQTQRQMIENQAATIEKLEATVERKQAAIKEAHESLQVFGNKR